MKQFTTNQTSNGVYRKIHLPVVLLNEMLLLYSIIVHCIVAAALTGATLQSDFQPTLDVHFLVFARAHFALDLRSWVMHTPIYERHIIALDIARQPCSISVNTH